MTGMNRTPRRTMTSAITLIALAGMIGPAMAQNAKEPSRHDKARQQRDAAPAREHRQVRDRDRQPRDDRPGDRQGFRDKMGDDALPAQLNRLVDLREGQREEIMKLIRDLRKNQMGALRELRDRAENRGRGGDGDRAKHRERDGDGGRAEHRERDGDGDRAKHRERDGDGGRAKHRERDGDRDRAEHRGRDGERDRAEHMERDNRGPMRGPRVDSRGEGRNAPRDEMDGMREGPDGRRAFAQRWKQMDGEQRQAMLRHVRKELVPINRRFGKELAEILDEGQRQAVRKNWERLSIMPPMVDRLLKEGEKAHAERGDKAKGKRKAKGKGAKRDSKHARGADKPRSEKKHHKGDKEHNDRDDDGRDD